MGHIDIENRTGNGIENRIAIKIMINCRDRSICVLKEFILSALAKPRTEASFLPTTEPLYSDNRVSFILGARAQLAAPPAVQSRRFPMDAAYAEGSGRGRSELPNSETIKASARDIYGGIRNRALKILKAALRHSRSLSRGGARARRPALIASSYAWTYFSKSRSLSLLSAFSTGTTRNTWKNYKSPSTDVAVVALRYAREITNRVSLVVRHRSWAMPPAPEVFSTLKSRRSLRGGSGGGSGRQPITFKSGAGSYPAVFKSAGRAHFWVFVVRQSSRLFVLSQYLCMELFDDV
ncbi:hypothetical protein EVAR_101766_1 [Eumeta japonica]|uniref:Uncharacterized protein n=1 Tax=Eumeta variegata TaxID=151549 RepID=A0A4C1SQ68_EUMVA|nr:hypothetical protein EVAR_101766_1 [Eumeta japonica]